MVKINIKVGSFNVQGGLPSKCENDDFLYLVKCYDVFCVQE